MFIDDIFSTLNHWLNLEPISQEDLPQPLQQIQDDSDNFGGDRDPSRSGDREPPKTKAFSDSNNYIASSSVWHPSQFDGWGDPIEDANYWQHQQGNSSCAVVAQISVCESITGTDISEVKACQIAQANGWFDPESGTSPENIGKILEYWGIPCHKQYDATLVDIADALERGDKVIVGLDANEIWYPALDPVTGLPIEQPTEGHAVWVTGIDQEADGSVKIILNDSGTPDGRMKAIDAKDFLNAWEDYSNFLVVADTPDQPALA